MLCNHTAACLPVSVTRICCSFRYSSGSMSVGLANINEIASTLCPKCGSKFFLKNDLRVGKKVLNFLVVRMILT